MYYLFIIVCGVVSCSCHVFFCLLFFLIFFFKQKTAYEMRISDWSSDVCSSDLRRGRARDRRPSPLRLRGAGSIRGELVRQKHCPATPILRPPASERPETDREPVRENPPIRAAW